MPASWLGSAAAWAAAILWTAHPDAATAEQPTPAPEVAADDAVTTRRAAPQRKGTRGCCVAPPAREEPHTRAKTQRTQTKLWKRLPAVALEIVLDNLAPGDLWAFFAVFGLSPTSTTEEWALLAAGIDRKLNEHLKRPLTDEESLLVNCDVAFNFREEALKPLERYSYTRARLAIGGCAMLLSQKRACADACVRSRQMINLQRSAHALALRVCMRWRCMPVALSVKTVCCCLSQMPERTGRSASCFCVHTAFTTTVIRAAFAQEWATTSSKSCFPAPTVHQFYGPSAATSMHTTGQRTGAATCAPMLWPRKSRRSRGSELMMSL
jgi:hypothetical protein